MIQKSWIESFKIDAYALAGSVIDASRKRIKRYTLTVSVAMEKYRYLYGELSL